MARIKHQELLKRLIRLHILHHASDAAFYGQWMIQELARQRLHPQSGYPLPHASWPRRVYLKSNRFVPIVRIGADAVLTDDSFPKV